MGMHTGIPICIRGSPYATMCIVWGSGDMNLPIYANNFAKNRVPPYAYEDSPYAQGDSVPKLGISEGTPRMHTVVVCTR